MRNKFTDEAMAGKIKLLTIILLSTNEGTQLESNSLL